MKLLHAPASPFARKARALIIELGLEDSVELVEPGAVTPVSNNLELNALNPLGMIPTLMLDNGEALMDSTVICEYLNHVGQGNYFPNDTEQKFRALKLQSMGDGIMDLSVALRYETAMRPAELQWPTWIGHQREKIARAIKSLDSSTSTFTTPPTIGELSVACALGYLDLRFADHEWRAGNSNLAEWYSTIMQRESLLTTIPG